MKLSNNAIEVLVTEIAGKDVLPLIELIRGKTDVSEFKIAEKLGKTVNEVRNMLYRLSDYNLVSFTRKKDKKKGWYIYYWTLNEVRAKEIFDRLLNLKVEKLNSMLKEEQEEQYYYCKEDKLRFKLVEAMDIDFKCPECGQVMEQEDNVKKIEKIKEKLQELENKGQYYVEEKIRKPKVKKVKKVKKKKIKKKPKKKAKNKRLRKNPRKKSKKTFQRNPKKAASKKFKHKPKKTSKNIAKRKIKKRR